MPTTLTVAIVAILLAAARPAAARDDANVLDLAVAYRAFERAYAEHPPRDDAETAAVNREIDRVMSFYFAGDVGGAIGAMQAATLRRFDGAAIDETHRAIAAVGLRYDPPAAGPDDHALRIAVRPLGPTRVTDPRRIDAVVRFTRRAGGTVVDVPLVLDIGPHGIAPSVITLDEALPSGFYDVAVVAADGFRWTARPFASFPVEPDVVAPEWRRRLDGAPAALAAPAAICRRRLDLLTDRSADAAIARLVLDPVALLDEVGAEVRTIEGGRDPYVGRTGHLWLPLEIDGAMTPCRVFRPAGDVDAVRPVIIALHGAGGNEHMFFEAYANGRLADLATSRGFVAVAPLTYPLLARPSRFEGLCDALATMVPVDPAQVGVIGHSLGAMTAATIAAAMPARFAATCLVAGGAPLTGRATALPPTRVYAAELDPLFSFAAARADAAAAAAAGLPVEFRPVPHHGHVLVVDGMLEEGVDWLLEQIANGRRSGAATPSGRAAASASPAP